MNKWVLTLLSKSLTIQSSTVRCYICQFLFVDKEEASDGEMAHTRQKRWQQKKQNSDKAGHTLFKITSEMTKLQKKHLFPRDDQEGKDRWAEIKRSFADEGLSRDISDSWWSHGSWMKSMDHKHLGHCHICRRDNSSMRLIGCAGAEEKAQIFIKSLH